MTMMKMAAKPVSFKMSGINTSVGHDVTSIYRLYNWMELQQMYLDAIPAYVYYIRHNPTGKYYYGFRSKNISENRRPEDDLWVKYFTSSKLVKELRENDDDFFTQVVYEDVDVKVAYWVEQECIKNSKGDPLCLNTHYIDPAKTDKVFDFSGKQHNELTKQKIKSHEPWNKGKSCPTGLPAWNRGIPTPDSVKELISERTTGIKKTEATKQLMRKPKTAEHAKNISLAARQRPKFPCEICGKLVTKANIMNHRNSHNV